MLKNIKLFFESRLDIQRVDSPEKKDKGIKLATAALFIELIVNVR